MRNAAHKNENGSILVIVLVITALLCAFSYLLPSMFSQLEKSYKVTSIRTTATILKENLISMLDNDSVWAATVQRQGRLSCLNVDGQTCVANSFGAIELYEADGTKYLSTNPNDGFDLQGRPCHTFDAVAGNETCVFQYQLSWQCLGGICDPTVKPAGPPAALVSVRPRINLIATLNYAPKNLRQKDILRLTAAGAIQSPYAVNMTRGEVKATLASNCGTVQGLFDPITQKCNATTKQPPTFQCPPNEWYMGLRPDGSVECRRDVKVGVYCPAETGVIGYGMNGSLICGSF